MPSTFTTGRADLEKPSNGSDVDAWDVPVNANCDAIDACFSASTTINTTGGTVTLTQPQMRCARVVLIGTLSSGLTLNFFAGIAGFFVVASALVTNGNTVTLGQSGAVATVTLTTSAVEALHTCVYVDGAGGVFLADVGGILAIAAQQLTPAGMIVDFGMNTAPRGYLLCDGSTPLKASYPNLWTAIGTTWGPATSTTFTLPNLQGQFRRGWDQGGTIDPARAFASAQTDEFKKHNHGITEPNAGTGHKHTVPVIAGVNQSGFNNSSPFGGGGVSVDTSFSVTGITINDAGTATETRPKNYAVLTCIKT